MRTTPTLDDDAAAKLRLQQLPTPPHAPFRVNARDMGELRPGLNLDNISELIEPLEGPLAQWRNPL